MATGVGSFGLTKVFRTLHPSSLFVISIRHMRKPRWVPMAKTKMFKIKEAPSRPRHETEEYARLVENYQTHNRSLWMFQQKVNADNFARHESEANTISEQGDLERILAENERDNAIVRTIREERQVQNLMLQEEKTFKKRQVEEEKELKRITITEQKLKDKMERMQFIIRDEDLDEVIEKVLASEVDYNFAVDKDGKIYRGRINNSKGEIISPLTKTLSISKSIESM